MLAVNYLIIDSKCQEGIWPEIWVQRQQRMEPYLASQAAQKLLGRCPTADEVNRQRATRGGILARSFPHLQQKHARVQQRSVCLPSAIPSAMSLMCVCQLGSAQQG